MIYLLGFCSPCPNALPLNFTQTLFPTIFHVLRELKETVFNYTPREKLYDREVEVVFKLPVSCLTFHKRGAEAQKVPEYPFVYCWTQTRLLSGNKQRTEDFLSATAQHNH